MRNHYKLKSHLVDIIFNQESHDRAKEKKKRNYRYDGLEETRNASNIVLRRTMSLNIWRKK